MNQSIEKFDREYVNDSQWRTIQNLINKSFPQNNFSVLDIGGGNGKFADLILETYPLSTVTILDNSELILSLNKTDARKKIILGSVENLTEILVNCKYDLIFFNWTLHHFVKDSYTETRKTQIEVLVNAGTLLSSIGYISVFENIYDGIFFKNLPSYLIFYLTSNKTLAHLVKKMGANTAGCGVCFLSEKQWHKTFEKASLIVSEYTDFERWRVIIPRRIFLHIGPVRVGHFWLSKKVLN
ncbi:methyltransferase domain-containing protein [Dolichospermum circinale]|uniref:methyltransferase domain-containing protein n=1 Tax=Dolichospermum circinale TaxID=109265 RepID=UPI0009DB93AF